MIYCCCCVCLCWCCSLMYALCVIYVMMLICCVYCFNMCKYIIVVCVFSILCLVVSHPLAPVLVLGVAEHVPIAPNQEACFRYIVCLVCFVVFWCHIVISYIECAGMLSYVCVCIYIYIYCVVMYIVWFSLCLCIMLRFV